MESKTNSPRNSDNDQATEKIRNQLFQTFNDSLLKTKEELEQVKQKLHEYDDKFEASSTVKKQGQKASDYLYSTLEEIKVSLDSLSEKAQHAFVEAKDFSKEALQDLWNRLKDSIKQLEKLVLDFDKTYHVTDKVADLTAPLQKQLSLFSKSLDQAGDAIKDLTKSGRSYLIGAAASLEHKYNIEQRLTGIDQKFKIVETAKTLQTKSEEFIAQKHILERVKQLDERLTGSKASEYLEQGVKIVSGEIEKVQQEYETAKTK